MVVFSVGTDELHEQAAERKRNVDDQAVFVATQIKDHSIITNEIDSPAELPFYFGRIGPPCLGRNRDPGPDRAFGMRVTRPEFPQRPTGDNLHSKIIPCHRSGDN